MLSPRELARRLPEECRHDNARVALVFGREDSGLTNDELHRCHAHVHIPTNADFSSLNLAAAVQVVAYECRVAWLEQQTTPADAAGASDKNEEVNLASHADLERYFTHLEHTLTAIEFHDPDKPRQLMARLRRLYLRAHPEQLELNILRGILTATDKATQPPRS
jgi:tRNA/rRNA methyltransferase/tRNA (cytidine32/uridine32-2'-O)-methyltransferase